ncbi:MAG: M20/M25/M40 family metallo-hydrolase, partial [Candidatus Omnitrophica bacterium]|nr:M20/M25/M40 family metallo-hydrolase [Candidatus Omnitrophota bacterium]
MRINKAIKLLQNLIKIDTQNPPGNEKDIVIFIRGYLDKLRLPYKIYTFKHNRPNLVCRISSKNSFKTLLFTPHLDTVPVGSNCKFLPFSGEIYKKRIYGRGATDCKVNVAACLELIRRIVTRKIRLNNLDLVFAFCADEETGSHFGIIPLLNYLNNINWAVVLDSDDFNIIVAQKGLLHLHIELFGKEAHGAYPERGVNAIEKAINILKKVHQEKLFLKYHPLLKKPTINIGRIGGGDKVNIVAGYCFFQIDIRYIPKIKKEEIIKKIESIVKKEKIKYKIKVLAHQEPIQINKDILPIKILKKVLTKNKIKFKLIPSFGATVINFLKEKNIEAFSFGFGTSGTAHTKDEYVKIDNLLL